MKMFYISFGCCCCCCCRSQIKDRFFVRFEIDIKTNWMLMLFGWTGFFFVTLSFHVDFWIKQRMWWEIFKISILCFLNGCQGRWSEIDKVIKVSCYIVLTDIKPCILYGGLLFQEIICEDYYHMVYFDG